MYKTYNSVSEAYPIIRDVAISVFGRHGFLGIEYYRESIELWFSEEIEPTQKLLKFKKLIGSDIFTPSYSKKYANYFGSPFKIKTKHVLKYQAKRKLEQFLCTCFDCGCVIRNETCPVANYHEVFRKQELVKRQELKRKRL